MSKQVGICTNSYYMYKSQRSGANNNLANKIVSKTILYNYFMDLACSMSPFKIHCLSNCLHISKIAKH